MIAVVNDRTFGDEVLGDPGLVLVEFFATWCKPCSNFLPHLEAIARDYADRAKVVKVNVDESRQAASRYNVRSIPAFFLFSNGDVVEQMVGASTKQHVENMILKHAQPGSRRQVASDSTADSGGFAPSFDGDIGLIQRRGK
jgi:thioredoxin